MESQNFKNEFSRSYKDGQFTVEKWQNGNGPQDRDIISMTSIDGDKKWYRDGELMSWWGPDGIRKDSGTKEWDPVKYDWVAPTVDTDYSGGGADF